MGVEYECFLLPRPVGFRPTSAGVVRLVEALREERWIPSRGARNFQALVACLPGGAAGIARRAYRWLPGKRDRNGGLELLPEPLTAAWLDAHPDTRLEWKVMPNETLLADEEPDLPADTAAAFEKVFSVRHPLTPIDPSYWPYYDLVIDWTDDYIEPTGQCLETLCRSLCRCGTDLEHYLDEVLSDGSRRDDPFRGNRYFAACPGCGRAFDASDAETIEEDGWTKERRVLAEGGVLYRFALRVDCGKCIPHAPPQPRFRPELVALCQETLGCSFVEAGNFF